MNTTGMYYRVANVQSHNSFSFVLFSSYYLFFFFFYSRHARKWAVYSIRRTAINCARLHYSPSTLVAALLCWTRVLSWMSAFCLLMTTFIPSKIFDSACTLITAFIMSAGYIGCAHGMIAVSIRSFISLNTSVSLYEENLHFKRWELRRNSIQYNVPWL